MLPEVNRAVAPLRSALESDNWKDLGIAIHRISTSGGTTTSAAVSSETIRVATDILIEECAFGTAFERAFVVRRALHGVDVGKWLYSALMHVNPASPVARRLVTLVECLSTTEVGRTLLGRNKIADAILHIWKRSPSGRGIANLPAALCALCSGHIDNIARVMRIGGVSVILRTLESEFLKFETSEDDEESENKFCGDRKLINNTLLLLGLICICIPDKPTKISGGNRKLVPLMAKIMRIVCEKERSMKGVLAHAINVVANIAECWRKEGAGFEICDGDALLADVVRAWKHAPRNRQVVTAASWAITGLLRAGQVDPNNDTEEKLREILAKSSRSISSVRAIRRALAKKGVSEETKNEPSTKKRSREEVSNAEEEESVPSKRPRLETVPSTPRRPILNKDGDEDHSSPTRLDAFDFEELPDLIPRGKTRTTAAIAKLLVGRCA